MGKEYFEIVEKSAPSGGARRATTRLVVRVRCGVQVIMRFISCQI
jgi:hypothetical protein